MIYDALRAEPVRVHSILTAQHRSPGSDLTFPHCVYRYLLRIRFPHVYLMSSQMAKDSPCAQRPAVLWQRRGCSYESGARSSWFAIVDAQGLDASLANTTGSAEGNSKFNFE